MRILIATDAWHPQVNGVVRTLTSLARSAAALGAEIEFPDPGRVSVAGRADLSGIAHGAGRTGARSPAGSRRRRRTPSTSRPKGRSAGRCGPIACAASSLSRPPIRRAFRNISRCARSFRPASSYAVLRHFHAAAAMTMVATASLRQELSARGFKQARHLDPRRRHRAVHARRPGRARSAAADLHDGRPRRRREEHRGVSRARPAGIQGRGRRRPAEAPSWSAAIPRPYFLGEKTGGI